MSVIGLVRMKGGQLILNPENCTGCLQTPAMDEAEGVALERSRIAGKSLRSSLVCMKPSDVDVDVDV